MRYVLQLGVKEQKPCGYAHAVAARKCTPLRGEQQATFNERLRGKNAKMQRIRSALCH